ncbi:MAG: hypothetical protein HDS65_02680 [Bacteroidales bacterium]|nr:hypothetical protein [Bacteroidales bacterium]
MQRLLHFFFPENDLALASWKSRYTAPDNAVRLRKSGETLPIWFADVHDCFLSTGVNADWYRKITALFGEIPFPYDHNPADTVPAPWGWSLASRQAFIDAGFPQSALPDDAYLDYVRQLSHRRTAADVAKKLAASLPFSVAPAAVERTAFSAVKDFVLAHPQGVILKLPWSSSGRGLVAVDAAGVDKQQSMIEGMIGRQGSIMAEPRYTKKADFALLYTIKEGKCTFDGYSLFNTERIGSYSGNVLASPETLHDEIAALLPEGQLDAVRNALIPILESVAPNYSGPLGVDMMSVEGDEFSFVPVVEINFRMTMGHVCHRFYNRFVEPGSRGNFYIRPASSDLPAGFVDVDVQNQRIKSGKLDMAQPGSYFSFVVEIG